ncbi:MAG: hypothetical protein WBB22_17560, partial [Anaerolineae bacterium]
GLLPESYGDGRISDADIEPSFPVRLEEYNLVQTDLLGDHDMAVEEWIPHGGAPDLDRYLTVDELRGEHGPWVLLDGYFCQEDLELTRAIVVFPRGLIVRREEANGLVEALNRQSVVSSWIPEIPADYYTYAGEIPWCDTFPRNERTLLKVPVGTTVTRGVEERLVLVRDNEPVPEHEDSEFWTGVFERFAAAGIAGTQFADFDKSPHVEAALRESGLEMKRRSVPVEREEPEFRTFEVLVPVRENNWEYYHTPIVPARSVLVPARDVAEHLDLCGQPQTFDLYTKSGRHASVALRHGEDWRANQKLIYLHVDLLERFLQDTSSTLVWVVWGEREFSSDQAEARESFAKQHVLYSAFQYIRVYSPASERG